ncbi:MAG: aspartate aminotransferase family protein [Desulforegulaceae bacterium]|nr:aspartate aminotransferase family protein [Desulforegulaceae bacterium]
MSELIEVSDSNIANTYARYPFMIERGEGLKIYDEKGRSFYDFFSGISVCSLGHCHPEVVEAVKNQAEKLFHVSNLYYTLPQTNLSKKLVDSSFADRVFFANSGAEANEAAIKLARKYGCDNYGIHKNKIITFLNSFHGRTLGTIAATGQDKIKKGFAPIPEGFDYAVFNDIESVKKLVSEKTCAIMLEPVQGEGGIIPADKKFLKDLRKLCDKNHILLIFDEIQTGVGRTGKLFCYENYDVIPDIMTLAKALGNGMPIGCMLASNHVMQSFGPGSHGTTFGGNPISCAAADKVLEIIQRDNLCEKALEKGRYLLDLMMKLKEKHKFIKDVRGLGLLIGVELDKNIEVESLVKKFYEKGFLINIIQGHIIRLSPPLIIDNETIEMFAKTADIVFGEL